MAIDMPSRLMLLRVWQVDSRKVFEKFHPRERKIFCELHKGACGKTTNNYNNSAT